MNLRKIITITASATIIATSFSTISNIESNLILVKADNKNEISNEQFDSDMNAAAMTMYTSKSNGFSIGDLDTLKADDGNRLAAYTGDDNNISFKGLLSSITNGYNDDENSTNNMITEEEEPPVNDDDYDDVTYENITHTYTDPEYTNKYNAVKYLYNYFYNRFDPQTQTILSSYYKDSSDTHFCDLAVNLGDAIQNWGEKFDDVAPSPREVKENNAKEQAKINKRNAKNKRINISRAKKNLKITKSKYNKAKHNLKKHHSKKNKKLLKKAKRNLKVAQHKYNSLT